MNSAVIAICQYVALLAIDFTLRLLMKKDSYGFESIHAMIAISNLALNLSVPCHNLLRYSSEGGIYTELSESPMTDIHKQRGPVDMVRTRIFFQLRPGVHQY
ncbi:hypothetical protein V2G26_016024 [Clonostachys chloroleuca]